MELARSGHQMNDLGFSPRILNKQTTSKKQGSMQKKTSKITVTKKWAGMGVVYRERQDKERRHDHDLWTMPICHVVPLPLAENPDLMWSSSAMALSQFLTH